MAFAALRSTLRRPTATPDAPIAASAAMSAAPAVAFGSAADQYAPVFAGRVAGEAAPLAKALDGKSFNTNEVIKVLRRMAIDTRAGAGMLKAMAVWPEAASQQAALQAFYEDLARRIDSGLGASVNSTSAY